MGIEQYLNREDRDELLFESPDNIRNAIKVTKETYENLVEMLAKEGDPDSHQSQTIRDLIDRTHRDLVILEEKLDKAGARLN